MDAERRLAQLDDEMPEPMDPAGTYRASTLAAGILHVAGQGPVRDGEIVARGRLGEDLDVAAGQEAARLTALNVLAVVRARLGSLERISQALKATAYIAATPEFQEHAAVADGATDVFVEVLGEAGRPARAAVGVASLPFGIPFELEASFEIDPES